MKKGTPLVIGLGVLIVALVLVGIFWPATKTGTPPAPVVTELQRYTNTANGFLLEYPKGATVKEGDPEGIYLDADTNNATTVVSIVFPRVDTFSENGSHGYYQAQVRVTATMTAKFACAIDSDTTPTVTTGSDAGAGNRLNWTRYGYCHGGKLYGVYDLFMSGSDGTPLTPKLEADIATMKTQSAAVAKSFEFVQ